MRRIRENIYQEELINQNKTKLRHRRILLAVLEIFFITIMIISLIKICLWIKDNKDNSKALEDVADNIIIDSNKDDDDLEKYTINFEQLKKKNQDIVAWIKVNGTKIEYPVVKSKDNNYYLTHSIDNSYNQAGSIFADYRNKIDDTDKNIIIYGHNRKDGSMFGSMKSVLSNSWYLVDENRKIIFVTETEKSIYDVFSIYKIEQEDYYIQTEFDAGGYKKFISTLKNRSIKNFGVEVNENDQILTLSTCGNSNNYRIVLHAKRVK